MHTLHGSFRLSIRIAAIDCSPTAQIRSRPLCIFKTAFVPPPNMAPSSQSVSDFVNDRVTAGYSGALTLDERRRRMREGVEHVRNSVSPRPRRGIIRRHDSNSTIGSRATVSPMGYHRGDRWDTDTEQLDDASTIHSASIYAAHEMKAHENGHLHDFAPSPAPDYSTSVSGTEEEDDRASTAASVSVKTEPINYHPPQSLNAALLGKGQNTWANPNHGRPRTANNVSNSLAQLNGHQAQQHHFKRQSMIGASLPYHTKPQQQGASLRPREASAPPSISPRSRAFSPAARHEMSSSGGYGHGYSNPPTSHPMLNDELQTPPIDEEHELDSAVAMYGQARQISIKHSHSISNLSQASILSRANSVQDFRSSKSSMGRFRTKRSHVTLRRARQRPIEAELDYSSQELSKMKYQQLADEDFDQGPAKKYKPSAGIDFPDGTNTLEDKCEHLRKVQDNRAPSGVDAGAKSIHEVFFAGLAIEDYEECGDLIVGQLAGLMDRLRKTRQAKRRAARDFEDEVAKREALVSSRTEGLQKELQKLKKSGQEALTAATASNTA